MALIDMDAENSDGSSPQSIEDIESNLDEEIHDEEGRLQSRGFDIKEGIFDRPIQLKEIAIQSTEADTFERSFSIETETGTTSQIEERANRMQNTIDLVSGEGSIL